MPGADPNTVSLRAICAHTVEAAHRYADYIRKARGLPFVDIYQLDPQQLAGPADVRPRLGVAFRTTEAALDGLYGASEAEIARVTFPVRWGPTYDPEMILEHGLVHLLRLRIPGPGTAAFGTLEFGDSAMATPDLLHVRRPGGRDRRTRNAAETRVKIYKFLAQYMKPAAPIESLGELDRAAYRR